jgi:pimeloyl-ACP methyl ester carboxylesterase
MTLLTYEQIQEDTMTASTTTASPIPGAEARTLDVPGATLTYDIRRAEGTSEPPLVLIGSPMGAGGFPSLAAHFTDRTIVSLDPRNNGERSPAHDPSAPITPEVGADDVHRVIEAVGGGPVDLFGSSGGAVLTLALIAKYPGDVRTAVAHEPPLASLLPDREHSLGVVRSINETYHRSGGGAGMAYFIQVVSHAGPFTAEDVAAPPPDPQMFGMPADDDGIRTDLMLEHHMRWLATFEPDFDAIKRAPTRLVLAAGEESEGILASRGAYAAAERLGSEVVIFPGGHGGFMGGEYGQEPGKPAEFAAKLREVLAR